MCPLVGSFCYFMSGIYYGGWVGGGGAVTDTFQLALTTLTTCGKRKGAEMEGSPAVEVTGQS